MVACVHLPRFELTAAAGDHSAIAQQTLAGAALAVAPMTGADGAGGRVGEVSGAAEARGVTRGMMLGEALARCPDLILVPGNPVRVSEMWEQSLVALESIGATVEPARAGLVYFETDGLRGLHGSHYGTVEAARRALGRPARMGAGPTRFCSLAAALATRSRRALLLEDREAVRWLAARPIHLLAFREETAMLVPALTRLGVRTLGELVKLGRPALSDRFGVPGRLAHELARGKDSSLQVRSRAERLEESMELGDASSGTALKRVLGVLISRLLARPERRGRTLRSVGLSAHLVAGGGWYEQVVFRQALSDPERIWLALSVRLLDLPAPAAKLRLNVDRFGPPGGEQGALLDQSRSARAARLREAIAQVRTIAGKDAALRAVCIDPDSRVPERRMVLAPVPE
jgi:protein ImuB